MLTKIKLTYAELGSLVVLIAIFILFLISFLVDYRENEKQKAAKDIAYNIAESGKLAHMSMENKGDVVFTENSYFDGNNANHGPFLLTIDKYQNTTMNMWVDNQYCVRKQKDQAEFVIDDSVTKEADCLAKQSTVTDLLNNYDLIEDTEKTGLDLSNPFASKKYYAGSNPSNYVVFSKACFRILNITSDNYLKIIYEGSVNDDNTCTSSKTSGSIDEFIWDETGSRDWNRPSTLRNLLEVWNLDNNINNVVQSLDSNKLVTAPWYTGVLKDTNEITLKDLVAQERSSVSNKELTIGILNISDYLKASSNVNCQKLKLNDKTTCSLDNYLLKSYDTWFLNTLESSNDSAFMVDKTGVVVLNHTKEKGNVRPVLYLTSDVVLKGSGRSSSPYVIGS